MAKTKADTLLKRRGALEMRLEEYGAMSIFDRGERLALGPHGLEVLKLFNTPKTLRQAMTQLKKSAAGRQDWIDRSATLLLLVETEILVPAAQDAPVAPTRGFGASPIQATMLNDTVRTEQYLHAIQETIKPGDVVIDLGTGTGILALAAARAGAAKVYAIEATEIADTAKALFEENGFGETIELVRGWSTQIELPQRGDLLVSEVFGHEPLAERVLELTRDAQERLLKPDARLLPRGLTINLTLAEAANPKEVPAFTPENITLLQQRYGFQLNSLHQMANELSRTTLRPGQSWRPLSPSVPAVDLRFAELKGTRIAADLSLPCVRAGRLDGIIVSFDVDLRPKRCLQVSPFVDDSATHWRLPIYCLKSPRQLQPGDEVRVGYRYHGQAEVLLKP